MGRQPACTEALAWRGHADDSAGDCFDTGLKLIRHDGKF